VGTTDPTPRKRGKVEESSSSSTAADAVQIWKILFGGGLAAKELECSDGSDVSESSSDASQALEEIYFNVVVDPERSQADAVEQDVIKTRCRDLRALMRRRPCLPCKEGGGRNDLKGCRKWSEAAYVYLPIPSMRDAFQ
jgi:hypothetical protein